MWRYDKIETEITALIHKKTVGTIDSSVAAIVTGAKIRTANGLVNPPQR